MNDPLAQQLLQAVTAYGPSFLEDRARVEQVLAGSTAESPGKVKALLLMLDKKAVSFLLNWAKETRADKATYEQIRQKMSTKFEQANLLTGAAASWALDAWAVALGIIRPVAASAPPPRPVGAPASTNANAAAGSAQLASQSVTRANVYAPPASHVEDASEAGSEGSFIEGGRSLPAGRGWAWFVEGWNLFKQYPGIWIANLVLFMIISVVIQVIPLVGWFASTMISPVLVAGMMLGAHAIHMGEPLEIRHLFAGFKERTGPLVVIGVSFLGFGKAPQMAMGTIALALILGVLLVFPLMMAYYYAPALVAVSHRGPGEAMKLSFMACLKNVMPGLVYFVVFIVAAIIATIPLGLGWFVLGPVAVASVYAAYRDIFYE